MKKLIENLKDVWFVVVFLVGLILWYGSVSYRLNAIEAKAQEQNNTLIQLMEMKADVAVIKAKVDYIYNDLK